MTRALLTVLLTTAMTQGTVAITPGAVAMTHGAAAIASGNGGEAARAMPCTSDVVARDAVVGDPFDGAGAVYLVSDDEIVPVKPPTTLREGDGFGWSVALAEIDGDGCADLLVGAPYADVESLQDAGVVYIMPGKGGAPIRVTSPEPQPDAHFGWSVAAKGEMIAVGAPYEDQGDLADTGSVYVLKGQGKMKKINQESKEILGNPEVGDQYGWALAFGAGNSLVVGVPYENDDGAGVQNGEGRLDSGSVSIIADITAQKPTAVKWEPPDDRAGDRFGYAVAYVEGMGIAVGAPQADFVQFLDAAGKPTRKVKGEGNFGFSLAASKDGRLAVGAPYAGGTGAVRILSGSGGSAERRLVFPPGGRFGWSVAFAGNRVLAGAPDAAPYGMVGIAGRNEDTVQELQPPKGVEFGASAGG
ncbi:hypothetical protein ACFSKW_54025 [Nonomuraea mangrovi]|uniref:FG-GAP repeat-containing protein n=1 Tax=Nonomuraea mangrovi TaxID=2316207 RepID=A0ABW4TIZ4_9ACTN